MADRVVTRMWDLKTTDRGSSRRSLRRDNISQYLFAEAEKVVHAADLTKGAAYLAEKN